MRAVGPARELTDVAAAHATEGDHAMDAARIDEPFCDAPARHTDHITPYRDGGPTTFTNGRATCVRSDRAREMPGWQVRLVHDGTGEHPHTVVTVTHTEPPTACSASTAARGGQPKANDVTGTRACTASATLASNASSSWRGSPSATPARAASSRSVAA